MDEQLVKQMSATYDAFCDRTLLPLQFMNHCDTRLSMDNAIVSTLDVDPEVVASIRRELTREPAITGERYETA